jgi:hypothetical protein
MPIVITVYRGWVGGKEIDRIELETMGVQIYCDWNPIGAFDRVQMTADVYKIFRERWKGRGVWGLIPRKETVMTAAERAAEEEDIPF